MDAAAVEADLDRVMASLEETYPDANRGFGVSVQPLRDVFPGPTDTRLLLLLTAVSLFVLLIACANVANLLLARAEARQREIAVRTALGAGRTRIVRQLLTESVLLALLAGGLGTLAAVKGVAWLSAQMPPELPDAFDPALRPEVLLATLATALAAGVLFGLAPALHAVSGDLRSGLGEGARGGTAGARRKRLRSVFVVGQLAVALTLLTGAGILAQAFNEQLSLDPRFDAEGLLTFQVALPEYRYADDAARVQGIERIERALEADPRIAFAAPVTFVPRGQSLAQRFFTVEGVEAAEDAEPPAALYQAVSPGFFEGLGVEVRRGRGIDRGDRAETEPVVVVNEALVRRYLDDGEPLGRRLVIGGVAHTVVGVVRDFVQQRIVDDTGVAPAVFVPFAQHPARATAFLVRAASSEPGDLAAAVREAVWSVDPDQPIGQVATFERFVADSLAGPRAIGLFLAVFGVLALLLSAIGIYGVMAQTVGQQTREIGIRLALGAERGQVVGLVTRQGMMLAGLGLLIGLPLSWAMIRAIEATLSGVSVFRPGLFAWVLGGLTAASLLATYLPARRAARIEPVRALQGD
ncbi:MAG: FtsX-like permease family protein [Gemmatimonadetes bacterium]|nr:MAG: FtsX-like permease family protein [Gemmatimonadota bacterium]